MPWAARQGRAEAPTSATRRTRSSTARTVASSSPSTYIDSSPSLLPAPAAGDPPAQPSRHCLLRSGRPRMVRRLSRTGHRQRMQATSTAASGSAPPSFQDLILRLHTYWSRQGCVILQPYDVEMGAGTFHPATTLRALGPRPWRAAYVQPSRRPSDGRYGQNPNRLQHYYQYQVIMKP